MKWQSLQHSNINYIEAKYCSNVAFIQNTFSEILMEIKHLAHIIYCNYYYYNYIIYIYILLQ